MRIATGLTEGRKRTPGLKPICASCKREMAVDKNGVILQLLTAEGRHYGIVHADRHRCTSCNGAFYTAFGAVHGFEYSDGDYIPCDFQVVLR